MAYNKYIINNLAIGLVNTTLTAGSTTLVLGTGQGALFPTTFPFILKLEGFTAGNVVRREIVKCTGRTGDTLTISRSFENCPANYTALSQTNTAFQFEVGDVVSLIISKEGINDIQNEVSRLETDKLNLSGGTMTGILNLKKSSNIVSASSINLSTATGNIIHITGTTGITSFINGSGEFKIIFDGILTLTHNATSLILPTSANITTAVGDSMIIVNESGNNWKVVSYTRISGQALDSSTNITGLTEDTSGDMTLDYFVKNNGTGANSKIKVNKYLASDNEAKTGTSQTKFINPKQAKDNYYSYYIPSSSIIQTSGAFSISAGSYTKVKEFLINKDGTYTIYFELIHYGGSGTTATVGRIYKNGVALGTQRSISTFSIWTGYSESFSFVVGDLVQLYGFITGASGEGKDYQARGTLVASIPTINL